MNRKRMLIVVASVAIGSIASACGGPVQGAAAAPPGTTSAVAPANGNSAAPEAAAGVTPAPATQTNGPLHAERTVAFKTGQAIDLSLMVGPVRLRSVTFVNDPKESIGDRFHTRPGKDTETVVRAAFDAENRESKKWEVTFDLTFLDDKGKLVDRVNKAHSWDGESNVYNLDNPILTYAIPLIKNVKITFDGKVD